MPRAKRQWVATVRSWTEVGTRRTLDSAEVFKLRCTLVDEPDRIIEVTIPAGQAKEIERAMCQWRAAAPFDWDHK